MKYRYLKLTGDSVVWGKNTLEKFDLVHKAQKAIDFLIDCEDLTYFDSETNSWLEIPGE